MLLLLLLVLAALPIILIYLKPKQKKFQKGLKPPGPRGLPLIGNLHQLPSAATLHVYLWQLSKKYGPLMSMKFGSMPVLIISSSRIAKQALKSNDVAFSSRPQVVGMQKLSYNGLDVAFAPYNDYWREMRKITVTHLLNIKRVQSFSSIREEEVSHMIKQIGELAVLGQLVNLSELSVIFTSTVICRIGFGKRFGKGFESKELNKLSYDAQILFAGIFFSDYFPSLGWIDKILGKLKALEKNFQGFDSIYQEIVEEHLNPNRSKASDEDIVDILISLRDENSSPFEITQNHIKAMLMNVLIGGTDTVATVIVWTMTALMQNPDIREKVQAEIRQLVRKKGIVDEDDIQQLPYLKAVIKETLRFYPPAPLLVPRETIQECTIDGYQIQPNSVVYFNAWAIGRDPENWKSPDEFLPERFLDSNTDYKGQEFEFIPFGAGRRGCPGVSMGMATVELALANLLYSFDWELPSGMNKEDIDTEGSAGLAMHKKVPLCLVAKSFL